MSKILVIALALILLVDQSVSFAIEQMHGLSSEAQTLMSSFGEAPAPGPDSTPESGSHCSHGCHFNHFLGEIALAPAGLSIPIGSEIQPMHAATRVPAASLDPPYRPPRFSSLT